MRSIVTLTTDFGTRDGFVAQMKGVVLSINPDARVVDVTHDIEPFSVLEGALVLKGFVPFFPEGTVHVAVVDPGVGGNRRPIAVEFGNRFLVGPDNGLFSLVLAANGDRQIRKIENPEYVRPDPHPTFHGRDVFAPVAAHLSSGKPFRRVGPLVDDPVMIDIPRVIPRGDGLDGQVIHVDRFGNLVSNITAEMLDRKVGSVTAGDCRIMGLASFFDQVDRGQPLALVNSFGFLEVAVNKGNASKELGLECGARVTVRWA